MHGLGCAEPTEHDVPAGQVIQSEVRLLRKPTPKVTVALDAEWARDDEDGTFHLALQSAVERASRSGHSALAAFLDNQ